MSENQQARWTSSVSEVEDMRKEASRCAEDYNDNPQYGGSIVAELCDEVLWLRGVLLNMPLTATVLDSSPLTEDELSVLFKCLHERQV
jgi:hypothetical protein